MARKPRNYRKEYDEYQGTPKQKKRRAARNAARSEAEKKGLVHKGDGKEVDHLGSNRNGDLRKRATRVISRAANRKRQPKRS